MLSAFVGPVWHWLDPFTTIHDLGAAALRAARFDGWSVADYPAAIGRWPAIVGFVFFVWLELVGNGTGPRTLFIVMVGYTAFTLAMMAQFGRDAWRAQRRDVHVWFGLLGRLAPYGPAGDPADGRIARRPYASRLLLPGWHFEDLVLVALGTASILFDGLSQTQPWFDVFGAPGVPIKTLQLFGFLGVIVAGAVLVSRLVGLSPTVAGLIPIAAGYLVAHYFTYLLIDGQRIVVALADPLQQGWDIGNLGFAFFEPSSALAPARLRLDGPAGRRRGRAHARRLGGSLRRGETSPARLAAPPSIGGAGAAGRDHGRPDDADALVARAGARGRGAGRGRRSGAGLDRLDQRRQRPHVGEQRGPLTGQGGRRRDAGRVGEDPHPRRPRGLDPVRGCPRRPRPGPARRPSPPPRGGTGPAPACRSPRRRR